MMHLTLVMGLGLFFFAATFFQKSSTEKTRSQRTWAFLLGVMFILAGLAVTAVYFKGFESGTFATDEYWNELTVNEPYRTVDVVQANPADYILFLCKMYKDAKRVETPDKAQWEIVLVETDCNNPDNWTVYRFKEKTPPIFIKQKQGGYKSITEDEAVFLKKALF